MTAPQNVVDYYRASTWGTRFGVIDAWHPAPGHHGHDLMHPANTPIPALRAGVVVYMAKSDVLGYVVAVQVAPGEYDGYAHTKNSRVQVGYRLSQGEAFASVAGPSDFHGTSWSGPHTHLTHGWATESILGFDVDDPAVIIQSVLGGQLAGTGSRPIGGGAGSAPAKPPTGEADVLYFQYQGGTVAARGYTIAVNPSTLEATHITDPMIMNAIANEVAAGRAVINPLADKDWEATNAVLHAPLSPAAFAQQVIASLQGQVIGSAPAPDLSPLLDAIGKVPEDTLAAFGLQRAN